MQLNRLEGLYWVGRTGGYASAARAMPYPITQPAVYQQVKRLEEELEVVLFERVGRSRMRLTPAGQIVFDFVAPFFEGFDAVVRAARASASGGSLRIQAAHQVVRELLPPWLAALGQRRPGVQIEVFEHHMPDLEGLRRGEVDLVVEYLPLGPPEDLGWRSVAVNYGFLAVPTAWTDVVEAVGRPQVLGDEGALVGSGVLDQRPFVAYSRHLEHFEVQRQALAHFGLSPLMAAHVERAECILAMVASGLGYSFIPSLEPGGPRRDGVAVIPVGVDVARFPVFALWRREGPRHPLVEMLLELMPEVPGPGHGA